MYSIKIKASGINNLTDARYFAAWGVDYLGFDMAQNRDNLLLQQVKEIKAWIEGPTFVGEFSGLEQEDEIRAIMEEIGLEGIQLGPFGQWHDGFNHYEVFRERQLSTDINEEKRFDFLVLNTDLAFSAWEESEKQIAQQMCNQFKTFLNLPFDAGDIARVIGELNPYGLILKGSTEEKVGFKSFEDLDEIFEVLETQV